MNKTFFLILVYILCAVCGVCYAQADNDKQIAVKTREEVNIYITVPTEQIKDTIASLEKEGWEFRGMGLNRDGTWTITMTKFISEYDTYIDPDMISDGEIPDGVIYTNHYPYHGKFIRLEETFKDGKCIKRKLIFNGQKE